MTEEATENHFVSCPTILESIAPEGEWVESDDDTKGPVASTMGE